MRECFFAHIEIVVVASLRASFGIQISTSEEQKQTFYFIRTHTEEKKLG